LTDVRKHLILLAFVSYEAVRLWWWGGNCGVVSFGKTPFFCSIPTLASKLKQLELFGLEFFRTRVPAEVPAKNYPGCF
jgi:hypothetical protein